jgi:hypothetical protein
MRGRRIVGAALVVAVMLGTIAIVRLTATSGRGKFGSDPATIAACVRLQSDGTERFDNRRAVAGVGRLGDALSGIANANPKEVSGTAFCSDYSGVFISVPHPSNSLIFDAMNEGRKEILVSRWSSLRWSQAWPTKKTFGILSGGWPDI